ncbi:hypothetical protein VPHD81_0129 [Vibrio phage D81]
MSEIIKKYKTKYGIVCEVFSSGCIHFSQNRNLHFAGNYYAGDEKDRQTVRSIMEEAAWESLEELNRVSNYVWEKVDLI